MEIVKLKNGSEEEKHLVDAVMMALRFSDDIKESLLVCDLIELCRDSNYKMFPEHTQILKDRSMLQSDGTVHQSIKNIVLSAAKGEGRNLVIGSPLA